MAELARRRRRWPIGGLFITVLLAVVAALLVAPIFTLILWQRVRSLERGESPGSTSREVALGARVGALETQLRVVRRRLAELAPLPTDPPPVPGGPEAPLHAAPVASAAPDTEIGSPPSVVTEARKVVPAAAARSAPPSGPPRAGAGIDLESLIAGRWLNRIGIVALLLAVAFFLKLAFDNQWVGPTGRVVIGLVAGSALLAYGQWLLGRGYTYFSEGITGLGGGVLYLSLYAAWSFYSLIADATAFGGMIAVTVALLAIAIGRDSERVALVALAGGFLTPALLSRGVDAQLVLFGYLAVLDAGLLLVARARDWRWVEPSAFLATAVYFVGWYDRFYAPEKLARTLGFAALFHVEFAAPAVLRARRTAVVHPEQLALLLANAGAFLLVLGGLLWGSHRWGLTFALLVLAGANLGVLHLLPAAESAGARATRLLFAGLALTQATLVVPVRLEGRWIVVAWALQGLVLVWSGLRARDRWMRGAGVLLLAVAGALLVVPRADPGTFLLNARFGTFAVVVLAYAVAAVLGSRERDTIGADERPTFALLGVAAHVVTLWALSAEVYDFAADVVVGIDAGLAQQLGLSLLWSLYATALIVGGVQLARRELRYLGLVVLGIAVAKVFLFDLSFLERAYRIVSFLVLGVILLGVSFLYQRAVSAGRERS